MSSPALADWNTSRAGRIEELFEVHGLLGRTRGRWQAKQVNWAIVLRLAAEFQGFARDLHSEASDFVLHTVAKESDVGASLLRGALLRERMIDHGNPIPKNLAKDFRRLGMEIWPALRKRYRSADRWQQRLAYLMEARNAIAHDDETAFAILAAKGWRLDLQNARSWRSTMNGLAGGLDRVVGEELAMAFGGHPWR